MFIMTSQELIGMEPLHVQVYALVFVILGAKYNFCYGTDNGFTVKMWECTLEMVI